ncbi:MAG: hypothetical protein WDZ35_06185 [Crocinitomicaceae bacterium]
MKIIEKDLKHLEKMFDGLMKELGCKLDVRIVKINADNNDSWSINVDGKTVIVIDCNNDQNVSVCSPIPSLNNNPDILDGIERSINTRVKQRIRNEKIDDLLNEK